MLLNYAFVVAVARGNHENNTMLVLVVIDRGTLAKNMSGRRRRNLATWLVVVVAS